MQTTYKTSDLALAAYLQNRNFAIVAITSDPINPQKKGIVFALKNSHSIETEVENFFSGNAVVDPRRYFDDIKNIKNRIYDHE